MKTQILTTKTVSKQKTITKKTKGINTMKKLILATCLMVGAAFASFAGVTINDLGPSPRGTPLTLASFTFTSDGSYGLLFGDWVNYGANNISAFGYYYLDDPTNLISGVFAGNNSDFFNSLGMIEQGCPIVDFDTGYLGEFKAGDTIGIWIQYGSSTLTSTDIEESGKLPGVWILRGEFVSMGLLFQFVEMDAPISGEPLPGVLAALAIGGCAFLGRKIRRRVTRSN